MDGDYPNPDDEFELMYADELEAMEDFDEDDGRPAKKSKKSLDFGSVQNKPTQVSPLKSADESMETDHLVPEPMSPTMSALPVTSTQVRAKSPSLAAVQQALNGSDLRKRKADHLFGDIDDIGSDEELELTNFDLDILDRKTEDPEMESDQRLIERIRHERQKFAAVCPIKLAANKLNRINSNSLSSEFISERIPRYPFISMRNFDNNKYYIRLRSDDYIETEAAKISSKNSGLLPGSYEGVWTEATTLLAEKKQIIEIARKCDALEDGDLTASHAAKKEDERLWVEKYHPKGYRDLLSDEGTNKVLLKWLKLWDQVVFNIKKKPKPQPKPLPENKNGKWKNSNKTFFQKKILNEDLDESGRPAQKIALLCGAPGLGKTTLAHIIAKHAGYNPVEVNASDDCSGDAFRIQLESATQMKSVLGDDPRPNCLILDEIDGALSAAIEVLLQFISDKDISKGKKKKGSKPSILKRPIICICNDLYVPALRPLRQVALIINFPPTASARLAQRLIQIAVQERLKTDLGTMLLLCDKTGNDIRSCLSFLHFFRDRSRQIGLMDVQQASVGQKDTHKGLFAVWHDIFQISKKKQNVIMSNNNNKEGPFTLSTRMSRVLKTVQSYGDYDRLCQGVHENYLHMKMRDSRFQSIAHGTEWFCHFDQVQNMIKETQNYCLMPYLPYCFATWHFLYAGMGWPVIKYPQTSYEVKMKTKNNEMTLSSVLRGMNPTVRSGTRAVEMLLDTLPLILYTIMPSLKNVNAQLFSVQEKKELHRVVNIFVEYNVTYIQERTVIGDMVYRMEPNVPELVQFPDIPHAPSATYAVKQLIAYETENEKIRRVSEATVSRASETTTQTPTRTPSRSVAVAKLVGSAERKAKQPEMLPNHLQTLSPQIRKPVAKHGLKNWLHVSKHTATVAKEKAAAISNENGLYQMSYVYKEGYSNAVRKTIRIADLL